MADGALKGARRNPPEEENKKHGAGGGTHVSQEKTVGGGAGPGRHATHARYRSEDPGLNKQKIHNAVSGLVPGGHTHGHHSRSVGTHRSIPRSPDDARESEAA